jgi:16S rRNA (guanine966-N2)-methyltransferase
MRVIAGTYRSRILKSLKGLALRPTSDRLRETLFNVLGAGISGSRFLDVFAGTGAVGIEALSRGATHAAFIENHALAYLKIVSAATVICADALRALESAAARVNAGAPPYDYVFIDPPWAATAEYSRAMQYLASSTLVAPDGIVIVEHRKSFSLPEAFDALKRVRVLRQGDAALSFYRRPNSAQNQSAGVENP